MNKENFQSIIDKAYDEYVSQYLGHEDVPGKEVFLHEIKTNIEFSARQGLNIEERELSLEERIKLFVQENGGSYPMDAETMDKYSTPRTIQIVNYKNRTVEL